MQRQRERGRARSESLCLAARERVHVCCMYIHWHLYECMYVRMYVHSILFLPLPRVMQLLLTQSGSVVVAADDVALFCRLIDSRDFFAEHLNATKREREQTDVSAQCHTGRHNYYIRIVKFFYNYHKLFF